MLTLETKTRALRRYQGDSASSQKWRGVPKPPDSRVLGLRQDVAFVISEFAYSERQACKLMSMDRTTYRYQPRPDHNAELRRAASSW